MPRSSKPEARWFVIFAFGLFVFYGASLTGWLVGADVGFCSQTAALAAFCWCLLLTPAKEQGWAVSQTFQLLRVALVGLFALLAASYPDTLGHLWIVVVLVWVADSRGLQF